MVIEGYDDTHDQEEVEEVIRAGSFRNSPADALMELRNGNPMAQKHGYSVAAAMEAPSPQTIRPAFQGFDELIDSEYVCAICDEQNSEEKSLFSLPCSCKVGYHPECVEKLLPTEIKVCPLCGMQLCFVNSEPTKIGFKDVLWFRAVSAVRRLLKTIPLLLVLLLLLFILLLLVGWVWSRLSESDFSIHEWCLSYGSTPSTCKFLEILAACIIIISMLLIVTTIVLFISTVVLFRRVSKLQKQEEAKSKERYEMLEMKRTRVHRPASPSEVSAFSDAGSLFVSRTLSDYHSCSFNDGHSSSAMMPESTITENEQTNTLWSIVQNLNILPARMRYNTLEKDSDSVVRPVLQRKLRQTIAEVREMQKRMGTDVEVVLPVRMGARRKIRSLISSEVSTRRNTAKVKDSPIGSPDLERIGVDIESDRPGGPADPASTKWDDTQLASPSRIRVTVSETRSPHVQQSRPS